MGALLTSNFLRELDLGREGGWGTADAAASWEAAPVSGRVGLRAGYRSGWGGLAPWGPPHLGPAPHRPGRVSQGQATTAPSPCTGAHGSPGSLQTPLAVVSLLLQQRGNARPVWMLL